MSLSTTQVKETHVNATMNHKSSSLPAWLNQLKQSAAKRFGEVGLPKNTDEEWRHTNLSSLSATHFVPGTLDSSDDARTIATLASFGNEASVELVFINGQFAPQFSRNASMPRGLVVCTMAEAISKHAGVLEKHLAKIADLAANPFYAQNTAQFEDGAFIHVARGAEVSQPIHVIFVSTGNNKPTISHPRVLVIAEDNSRASMVASYVGKSSSVYFTNAATEIIVGRDAHFDYNKLHQESNDAFHISNSTADLGPNATFVSHDITLSGKLTRNDYTVRMAGEYADATINGLVYLPSGSHCDNHTLLDHAKANCPSHELYKHILDGNSTAVFKGKILVRKDSQKTDSKQTSKTLLLSDNAKMDSMPALEIYADDVKCTHGSTTGPVDEEQVFYLRSRGVGYDAARHLLTYAFAADITRRIKIEPVRRRIEDYLAALQGLPQDLRITDLGSHDERARNL